jgi:hypothetical protein
MNGIRRFFLSIVIFALSLVCSCNSLPAPANDSDSLVVFVFGEDGGTSAMTLADTNRLVLTGHSRLALDIGGWGSGIETVLCAPGSYGATLTLENGSAKQIEIEVAPSTIVLFPFVFSRNPDGTKTVSPVGPRDQERAVKILSDYISFDRWIGREFEGFGPFRPRMFLAGKRYTLHVDSPVEGAHVFVDGEEWGNAPIDIPLPSGKYLLAVEREGYSAYRKYITVEGDAEVDASLVKIEKPQPAEKRKERFTLLIARLVNLGPLADAVYGTVFMDSFAVNFKDDRRLVVRREEQQSGALGKFAPDFREANDVGADLLLSGVYAVRNNKLFVWTGLYDVKSERTKLALLDTGEAGIKVFETVDRITARFSNAVAKTLPNPGEPVIVEEKEMTGVEAEYEKLLFEKNVIEGLADHANLFGLTIGLYGPEPPLLVRLTYERVILKELALCASIGVGVGDYPSIDALAGPSLTFKTGAVDLYCAALGFYSHVFQDFNYLGLNLETGLKIYMTQRKSGPLPYVTVGMMVDAVQFEFSEGWSNQRSVPMSGELFVGGGMGL